MLKTMKFYTSFSFTFITASLCLAISNLEAAPKLVRGTKGSRIKTLPAPKAYTIEKFRSDFPDLIRDRDLILVEKLGDSIRATRVHGETLYEVHPSGVLQARSVTSSTQINAKNSPRINTSARVEREAGVSFDRGTAIATMVNVHPSYRPEYVNARFVVVLKDDHVRSHGFDAAEVQLQHTVEREIYGESAKKILPNESPSRHLEKRFVDEVLVSQKRTFKNGKILDAIFEDEKTIVFVVDEGGESLIGHVQRVEYDIQTNKLTVVKDATIAPRTIPRSVYGLDTVGIRKSGSGRTQRKIRD
jgi:hypothetical protein